MKARFVKVAKELEENQEKIAKELLDAQGAPVDLGGYYVFDEEKAKRVMRPSPTLNAIIDAM
jgi:isocitrate dehydrogenase